MSALLEQSRSQVIHSAVELGLRAGGKTLEPLLGFYYRHMATEDLLARRPEDLLELADSVATNHKLRVDDQMHVPVLA